VTDRPPHTLVLWDIDRTLLYVGGIDRLVYRETFAEVVGRSATVFPARGTGMTMPLAIQGFLRDNGVPDSDVPDLTARMVEQLPGRLAEHRADLITDGILMPGALTALQAVHEHPGLVPTVLTGNLKPNAMIKLTTFELARFLDTDIGGFSSDDPHRPALVAIVQQRALSRYGTTFTRANTVIIGDSLEDVRTGVEGGARIVAVASGTTPADQLAEVGADVVLEDLQDVTRLIAAINRTP
jgi:phosphoglycolate phosphatase-like HAD superfamily hydrolase